MFEKELKNPEPTYEHDCDVCSFLGKYVYDNTLYDLYFCKSEPTVVARYGNEGPNYLSGLYADKHHHILKETKHHHILKEAKQRSINKNLYEKE